MAIGAIDTAGLPTQCWSYFFHWPTAIELPAGQQSGELDLEGLHCVACFDHQVAGTATAWSLLLKTTLANDGEQHPDPDVLSGSSGL